jgi:hypothetical protein
VFETDNRRQAIIMVPGTFEVEIDRRAVALEPNVLRPISWIGLSESDFHSC